MELKEGMYARSKYGIDKITKTNTYCSIDGKEVVYVDRKDDSLWGSMLKIEDIIKASYNIIDLIEVGDIIVGKDGHKFEVYAVGSDCVYINGLKEFILIDEIKAIVTKEQFKREAYKL